MTPRARQRRTRRRIRKAAGYLSLIAFLALLGSVGAVEQDLVPLLPGTIRMGKLQEFLKEENHMARFIPGNRLPGLSDLPDGQRKGRPEGTP